MSEVVLASASPRRRELLSALFANYRVEPADVPEPMTGDPRADALRLATEKAQAVAARHPAAVVIGADTIVFDGTRAYGKPASAADARSMLTALQGHQHTVVTGMAVVRETSVLAEASETRVRLAHMSADVIAAYVASGRPLDKAGAYAIQDTDVPTVSAWEGCFCGVMGLALWRLRRMLASVGVQASEPAATFGRCAACPERDT